MDAFAPPRNAGLKPGSGPELHYGIPRAAYRRELVAYARATRWWAHRAWWGVAAPMLFGSVVLLFASLIWDRGSLWVRTPMLSVALVGLYVGLLIVLMPWRNARIAAKSHLETMVRTRVHGSTLILDHALQTRIQTRSLKAPIERRRMFWIPMVNGRVVLIPRTPTHGDPRDLFAAIEAAEDAPPEPLPAGPRVRLRSPTAGTRLARYARRLLVGPVVLFVVIGVLCSGAAAIVPQLVEGSSSMSVLAPVPLGLVAMVFVTPLTVFFSQVLHDPEYTLVAAEDGVWQRVGDLTLHMPWREVQRIDRGADHVVVRLNTTLFGAHDADVLEGDLDAFVAEVQRRIDERGRAGVG